MYMALQLILGKSGAGKSYQLYHRIIKESMKHPEQKYFIVVPEQFTMQTQKDLVTMHPHHGICNIDVLSFMRLAYRVFEEQGSMKRVVLEDTGKSMIVRKVISEKKEQLQVFQNNVKKTGYISEIKSLLSEFFQYNIKEEQLDEMIELSDKKILLKRKLEDMKVVYQGFVEMLEQKFITTEEVLDVLADCVEESQVLDNCVLALDGFTGFTPVQYKLLHRLFRKCKEVIVTVTIDPYESAQLQQEPFQLFYTSRQMIQKLYKIAEEEKVKIAKDYIIGDNVPYRFKESSYLACMEKNLFRYQWETYGEYCQKMQIEPQKEDIRMYAGMDMQGEVDFVIQEIYRLIREENYRYREIAIVTGDMENYSRLFDKACGKMGFPCFVDYKKDIMNNSLVDFIRSLLDLVRKNYDYESMIHYLRSCFVDVESEMVDKLENYIIALGIKGVRRWKSLWTRTYSKDIDLEEMNAYREEIVENLESLRKELAKKENTVRERTIALHDFLVKQNTYEKLKAYEEKFEQENMPLLAKEYAQVYEIVLGIFDKIVQLLGDEKVTLSEFSDLLETGFSEAKVGLIPPGVDQIVIGDIERTRLKDIKALFFVGVNEGIIPKSGGKGGIISDLEREMLWEHQVELAPTVRQTVYTQRFYLYLNLTKPQNKLYIIYHKVDAEGKSVLPSSLLGSIQKIFPDIKVQEEKNIATNQEVTAEDMDMILNREFGKQYLLDGLRNFGQEMPANWWKELFSFYGKQEDFEQKLLELIHGVGFINDEEGLTKQVAESLYGTELGNSVTRVEQYVACAYAHFLQYGLQLKERYEFQFGGVDFGNIFHEVLRIFPEKLKEKGIAWRECEEKEMFQIADLCIAQVTADYGNAILSSSYRNAYMVERMSRIIKRTLWALTEQLRSGEFEPVNYEMSFSYMDGLQTAKMELGDGRVMRLHGRVDRLDVYDEKDAIYVKIMDYKTGKTTFQINNLYYGLQMQLVVYLNAAVEVKKQENEDKKVIPAGIFYYNIDDPIIKREEEEEKVRQSLLKELKMNGLVNKDSHIIQLLDKAFGANKELEGSIKSNAIPVETTKDGGLGKRSNVVDTEKFEMMGRFVNQKISQAGKEILDGKVSILPYRMKEKTACDFCKFAGVCNFDTKLPGNKYQEFKNMSEDEVWSAIKQDLERGKENGK